MSENGIKVKKLSLKKLILLHIAILAVITLGGFVLSYFEECQSELHTPNSFYTPAEGKKLCEEILQLPSDITSHNVTYLVNECLKTNASLLENETNCNFYDINALKRWLQFGYVTALTIGFGNLVPVTDAGKIASVVYIFISVPLSITFLSVFSSNLRALMHNLVYFIMVKLMHRRQTEAMMRTKICLLAVLCIVLVFLAFARFNMRLMPNISVVDNIYFIVVTISTIGYGDMYYDPSNNENNVLTSLLIMECMFVLLALFASLTVTISEEVEQRACGTGRQEEPIYSEPYVTTNRIVEEYQQWKMQERYNIYH